MTMLKLFLFLYIIKSFIELMREILSGNLYTNTIKISKKEFILYHKTLNRIGGYSLFELALDLTRLVYIIISRPLCFLRFFITFVISLFILSSLPFLFVLIYFISFFSFFVTLIICYTLKISYTFEFAKVRFDVNSSCKSLFIDFIKIPYIYAMIV